MSSTADNRFPVVTSLILEEDQNRMSRKQCLLRHLSRNSFGSVMILERRIRSTKMIWNKLGRSMEWTAILFELLENAEQGHSLITCDFVSRLINSFRQSSTIWINKGRETARRRYFSDDEGRQEVELIAPTTCRCRLFI